MHLIKFALRKSQPHISLPKRLGRVHTFQRFRFSPQQIVGSTLTLTRTKTSVVLMGPVHTGKVMGLPKTANDSSFSTQLQEGLKDNEKKTDKNIPLLWAAKKEWKRHCVVFPRLKKNLPLKIKAFGVIQLHWKKFKNLNIVKNTDCRSRRKWSKSPIAL